MKNTQVTFDILAGLGQELHAPLQSVIKSSNNLLSDYKKRQFEYISYKDFKKIMMTIEQMTRQLERCSQTTDRMMRLHPLKQPLVKNDNDIHAIVHDVLSLLKQLLKDGKIKVRLKLGQDIPRVAMGQVQCHQVIYNILLNAIQAMPAGGRVIIKTVFHKQKGMVQIIVEDDGVGIPPEHLEKIFVPFYTTKVRGLEKNSGLGLSIVYAIVTAAKGQIHIQSSLRQGTIVKLDLPTSFKKSS